MCINLAPEKWYVEADRKTVPPARRWFWRSSWFHHDIWSPWLAVMILLMSEDCNILSRSSLRAQLNDIPSRLERPTRPDGDKKKQTRYRHTQTRRITQTDRATEPRKIKQSLNSESNCMIFDPSRSQIDTRTSSMTLGSHIRTIKSKKCLIRDKRHGGGVSRSTWILL